MYLQNLEIPIKYIKCLQNIHSVDDIDISPSILDSKMEFKVNDAKDIKVYQKLLIHFTRVKVNDAKSYITFLGICSLCDL